MKSILATALLTGLFTLSTASALACTSIIVDKDETTDNSYLVGRVEDAVMAGKRFLIHKADENTGKLAYSVLSDCEGDGSETYGATGFNSAGVGMSGVVTIHTKAEVKAIDPYTENGVTESEILGLVLPQIHSAEEGVEVLGKIIAERGMAEGCGVSFVDKDGIWYMETAGGHHWLAQKIPQGKCFVTGNEGRLRNYDANDKANFRGSSDLVSFAKENKLYDTTKEFDFHEAYMSQVDKNKTYNHVRVTRLQNLLNHEMTADLAANAEKAPVFIDADRKVSLKDVKTLFRDHYNGTEYDVYAKQQKLQYRPVSMFSAGEVHIMQVRPQLPQEIGNINYIGIGIPDLAVFLPYYSGMKEYLPGYGVDASKMDSKSVYWAYRKLQTLVMTDYPAYAPQVKSAYADFEDKLAKKQQDMESKYLSLYKTDKQKADDLLQKFQTGVMQESLELTDSLTNDIFEDMFMKTQDKYHYSYND